MDDQPGGGSPSREDYRTLPTPVPVDQTVEGAEAGPRPDPQAARNVDQHRALRDD